MKDRLQQLSRIGAVAAALAFPAAENSPADAFDLSHDVSSSSTHVLDQDMPSQKILYASAPLDASGTPGKYDIYLRDLATDQTTNLTNTPDFNEMNPQASPDGQSVVFYSDRKDGVNQIYKLDIDDLSNVQRLTNLDSNDYDPTFSPDGTHIAYKTNRDDGYGDIWLMNADGTDQHNLTPDFDQTEEWKPEFVDDNHLVFTSRNPDVGSNSDELYTLDIASGKTTQITDNNVPDWYPDADPKTGKLVFISKENPDDNDAIYEMSLDGTDRVKITDIPGDSDDPSWSQDGKEIIFVNSQTGDYDIYTMNRDGSNVQPVEESPDSRELSPSFIPQTRQT